ncbi:MAG: hypothetical protein WC655_05845, partial [Candidatus Hydrogenedentales bacterium]
MQSKTRIVAMLIASLAAITEVSAEPLPNTAPLEATGDFAALMVSGIDTYLSRKSAEAPKTREFITIYSVSNGIATLPTDDSMEPYRQRLADLIGANEPRDTGLFEQVVPFGQTVLIGTHNSYDVHAVRWRVLRGIYGEGLLLEPKTK